MVSAINFPTEVTSPPRFPAKFDVYKAIAKHLIGTPFKLQQL